MFKKSVIPEDSAEIMGAYSHGIKVKEIEFLDKCSKIELINKGLSYAKVFKIYQDDKNLNKKLAYAYLKSSFIYIVGYLLNNNRIEEAKEQINKINNIYAKIEKLENLL